MGWPWVNSQIVPPVNIPNPTTKIGSKMGGEFTYPKMGSQWYSGNKGLVKGTPTPFLGFWLGNWAGVPMPMSRTQNGYGDSTQMAVSK